MIFIFYTYGLGLRLETDNKAFKSKTQSKEPTIMPETKTKEELSSMNPEMEDSEHFPFEQIPFLPQLVPSIKNALIATHPVADSQIN